MRLSRPGDGHVGSLDDDSELRGDVGLGTDPVIGSSGAGWVLRGG